MAKQNPKKRIIFLAIGFETTAPSTAIAVINAFNEKLNNFFVFSAHKIMPPAMKALVDDGVKINGYIGPVMLVLLPVQLFSTIFLKNMVYPL